MVIVAETNRSIFWLTAILGQQLVSEPRGCNFESTWLASSASVGVEGEFVYLVVSTSFGTRDMV